MDEDSLARYQRVPGKIGRLLRENIETEPTPHFRLKGGDRCPFLQEDGLCRLILTLGEDSLCDICAEHPRFYNEYPDRLEAGLGLCCEEAARLLLAGEGHLRLLADGEETEPDALLNLRGETFALLAEDKVPLEDRMEAAAARMGQPLLPLRAGEASAFFLTLERMDGAWTALLEQLAAAPAVLEASAYEIRHARIAEYLIYRHFAAAAGEAEAALRLQFCFYALRLIRALSAFASLAECLRLFSAEIEYSDENVEKICDWLNDKLT